MQVPVQARELAVGQEAGELLVPAEEPALSLRRCGLRVCARRRSADQDRTHRSEARKLPPGLVHDAREVSAEGPSEPELVD